MKTFRTIFLGSGFSKPAGLPLGTELFGQVRSLISSKYGENNVVEKDLSHFLEYLNECEGRFETTETVDYEEFLSYLDIEHFLGFKGKDTWSTEGNVSQLMIRRAIAEILYDKTPKILPPLYKRFVRQLNPEDWIYTFNYDTILESALDAEGIPYRLFPFRFTDIGNTYNLVDDSRSELVILKLHGSINWFDRRGYDELLTLGQRPIAPYVPEHHIFGPKNIVKPIPLTDGPRSETDPLALIYQIKDIGPIIKPNFLECTPLILSPSRTKILYSQPLRDFWWGIQRTGGLSLSLGVIGYSLPSHDFYARQALYNVYKNYIGYEPDLEYAGRKKSKFRILDWRPDKHMTGELLATYRFVDPDKTEIILDGFNEDSSDWFLQ